MFIFFLEIEDIYGLMTFQMQLMKRCMHQHTSTFPISKAYLNKLRREYEKTRIKTNIKTKAQNKNPVPKPGFRPHIKK